MKGGQNTKEVSFSVYFFTENSEIFVNIFDLHFNLFRVLFLFDRLFVFIVFMF